MTPAGRRGIAAIFCLAAGAAARARACDCEFYRASLYPDVSVQREASGTSWVPDSSPVHGAFYQRGSWTTLLHGALYFQNSHTDISHQGSRGAVGHYSTGWAAAVTSRLFGNNSKMSLRAMASLEPATVGGRGYPLLFQTGETWRGRRLLDRQHPHEYVHELAAALSHTIHNDTFFLYAGYPGEPAVGPPVYFHRPSAMDNPAAPLGHHWQDSTHVSFGVVTGGWRSDTFKVEMSAFRGREPDEHRYNFETPKLDSLGFRYTLNPVNDLSLQVSAGFIKSPERLEPQDEETRYNGTVIYNRKLGLRRNFAATLTYGGNSHVSQSAKPPHTDFLKAGLLEAEWSGAWWAVYGRAEYVEKFARYLLLPGFDRNRKLLARALTLGVARDIFQKKNANLRAGLQATLTRPDQDLYSIYGKNAVSTLAYLKYALGEK